MQVKIRELEAIIQAFNPFAIMKGNGKQAAAPLLVRRERASTVGSTQSSATYRSRNDLGLSDTGYEDAQIVNDNFETSLVYGESREESSSSLADGASILSSKHLDGHDEGLLRQEEERAQNEEEARIEQERNRATSRAKELGLLLNKAIESPSHTDKEVSNKPSTANIAGDAVDSTGKAPIPVRSCESLTDSGNVTDDSSDPDSLPEETDNGDDDEIGEFGHFVQA
jgi:hypothetical protein